MNNMRTPLGKVRGLGSAKDGTEHFWRQRLTAVANVPLIIFFVIFWSSPTWGPSQATWRRRCQPAGGADAGVHHHPVSGTCGWACR
jgi:hypothetical protein